MEARCFYHPRLKFDMIAEADRANKTAKEQKLPIKDSSFNKLRTARSQQNERQE